MDCNAAQSKLFAYVDRELGGDAAEELLAHLDACLACRRLLDLELAFREAYVDRLRPDPAPERVRERVAITLRDLVDRHRRPRKSRWTRRLAGALAAAVLLAVGFAAGIALDAWLERRNSLGVFAEAAVAQHQKLVRGLLPTDIKGVSPKGAEEWFRKRLAFNISLPELRNASLTFLGGRISHLGHVEVAALEYQVDQKHVSLFVIPEEAYEQLRLKEKPKFKVVNHRGYDLIFWRSHGTGYALVSEIGGRSCLVCHSPEEKLELVTDAAAHL
jgi:anti-sigma factor (TIGR02949 family)